MTFKSLGVNDELLKAVDALGFESPTRVQTESIPRVLEGKDLIVMAKTGSGKTGAFSMPIIQNVTEETHTQALILAPTRELAVQVEKDIQDLTKFSTVASTAVYGQHNMNTEINHLKKGKQIVVGTPGRMLHHIHEKNIDTKKIKYLVLDEADRMLDMGFIDQMIKIIRTLPRKRVTLLFSATMPKEIQRMCTSYMNNPETIEIDQDTKTVDSIKQEYYRVERNEKRTQLSRILTYKQPKSCMIFCNMRVEVDKVNAYLNRKGFLAEAIHGANTQNKRMRTINEFKNGEIQILVATDVAARGIHIDEMELVINYDVPQEKDSYIHRIGRTGRAGNGGLATSLITSDDIYTLYEIEEHVGSMIEEVDLPTDAEVAEQKAAQTDYWEIKKKERLAKRPKVSKEHSNKVPGQKRQDGNRKPNHNKSGNRPKPQQGKPQQGKPQQGKPQQGKPQQGKPQQGKPQQGKPVHSKSIQTGSKPYSKPKQTSNNQNNHKQTHSNNDQQHKRTYETKHHNTVKTVVSPPVQTPQVENVVKSVVKKKKFSLKNLFKRSK